MTEIGNYMMQTLYHGLDSPVSYKAEDRSHAAAAYNRAQLDRLLDALETRLEGRDYLMGDFSLVDVATASWLLLGTQLGLPLEGHPRVAAWCTRCAERPAFPARALSTSAIRAARVSRSRAPAAPYWRTNDNTRAHMPGRRKAIVLCAGACAAAAMPWRAGCAGRWRRRRGAPAPAPRRERRGAARPQSDLRALPRRHAARRPARRLRLGGVRRRRDGAPPKPSLGGSPRSGATA
jgi:hypothetical protein